MLPDFLMLKAELAKEQAYAITHHRSGQPLLSQIANYITHEGKDFILRRQDGSQEKVNYVEFSGRIEVDLRDIHQKGDVAIDVSWNTWRQTVNQIPRNSVPEILLENSRWVLPFALTYPHRVTREL